uniref:Uncharacterized protein n=1 Tax=Arundo donax TaxID=35708 RepID=A0A0A8YZ95_ARUDO
MHIFWRMTKGQQLAVFYSRI